MISLLIDEEIKSYDIIAIQKSWRNSHVITSLNSHHSEFHLLFRSNVDTKVCFYINDQIDLNSWEIEYSTSNLSILTVKTLVDSETQTFRIHNVYNSSSVFYSSRNELSILSNLARQLRVSKEHIVLRNFNLHHSYWSDFTRLTQHAVANALIDIIYSAELSLTLFRDFITWKTRESQSIIDFIFMSENMTSRLIHCMIRVDMRQSSDHISMFTRLCLDSKSVSVKRRRAWKLLNMKKLRAIEKDALMSRTSQIRQNIDHYTKEIRYFLQTIIEISVSWVTTYSECKSY